MREIRHPRNEQVCSNCPLYSESCRLGMLSADVPSASAIVFVFESPGPQERDWDNDLEGSKARLALNALMARLHERHRITIDYHAVWTVASPLAFDESTIKRDVSQQCAPYFRAQLRSIATNTMRVAAQHEMLPQLILVPFGKGAMSAVETKVQKLKDARGRNVTTTLDGHTWHVVPTLSLKQLVFDPGSIDQIGADLKKAAALAFRNFEPRRVEEITKDYLIPKTIEDVRAIVELIAAYSGDERAADDWPIATDLETTSLEEYRDSARILMASFAWERGKAAAIPLFHKDVPYDPVEAFELVKQLWAGPKPKILHHGKFDVRYGAKFGLVLNNWYMDSMYLKHASNEDASGYYDLKSLTIETALPYAGYEDQLKREMAKHGADLLVDRDAVYSSNAHLLEGVRLSLGRFGAGIKLGDRESVAVGNTVVSSVTLEDLVATGEIRVYKRIWSEWRRSDEYKAIKPEIAALLKLDKRAAAAKHGRYIPRPDRRDVTRAAFDAWVAFFQKLYEAMETLPALESAYVDDTIAVSLMSKMDPQREPAVARRTARWNEIKKLYARFGIPNPDSAQIGKLPSRGDGTGLFEVVPLETLSTYAAIDADVTFQSARELMRGLVQSEGKSSLARVLRVMRTLYIPGAQTLAKMEGVGIKIDREKAQRYVTEISAMMEESLEALAILTCKHTFEPAKNEQVIKALLDIYHVPYDDLPKTEGKSVSVNKELLASLRKSHAGQPLGDFCHHVLRWRMGHKAVNTYLAGFLRLSAIDGRVHTQLHLHRTVTSRLASSDPNLQNVPSYLCSYVYQGADGAVIDKNDGWPIKDLMIADDGYVLVNLDIKQAEVRVLCAYLAAIDPEAPLILAVNAGRDVPSYLTARITVFAEEIWREHMLRPEPYTGDFWEEVYQFVEIHKDSNKRIKFLRTATKRVLYGALYGAGLGKLAEQIFGALPIDEAERKKCIDFATTVRDLLFSENPEIAMYIEQTKQKAITQGYVDTVFGRRRHFPYVSATRRSRYNADAEREAVNFLIQSPASDLVLSQLIEVCANEHEIAAKTVLTVHDSMVLMVPTAQLHKLRKFLNRWIAERIPVRFPWLPVKYAFDVEAGPTYGRMISIDELEGDPAALNAKKRAVYDAMQLPADFYDRCQQEAA